jgi:peptide/nickel transport system permease protein
MALLQRLLAQYRAWRAARQVTGVIPLIVPAAHSRVVLRHAFRNSLVPLITVVAMSVPTLMGGAVVIEQVFAWPGMGQLTISSVNQNDYPVIIGVSLYVAVLVLICNLLADLLYAVADPRVRLG